MGHAPADRAAIGYVAKSQRLPRWMTLSQLEAYLAPLYPDWDDDLVASLRRWFNLDRDRRLGALSRDQYMKAAVLLALAPRPRLVLMDEPFTEMDALVKDELARALLESSAEAGWTVLVSSTTSASSNRWPTGWPSWSGAGWWWTSPWMGAAAVPPPRYRWP